MKQYYAVKAVHPDAILLFRVGDFYETFGDDAIKASGILGITLTRRANGAATFVELAGFPIMRSTPTYPSWSERANAWRSANSSRIPNRSKGWSSGASSSWLRRAWCWEIIFWPTRKIPIWRRSISAGKIPAWLFSIFQPANFMPPRAAMLTSTNSFPTWRRRKSSTSADTKTASPMRSAVGTIPIGSMSGSFRSRSTGTSSASSSALSRSRALVSNSSAAAFRRQGPFSTTSIYRT